MADLTPLQRARKDLETLDQWANEQGVDDRSLILLLKDVQQRCASGVQTEKVCMKLEDGFVEVSERFPQFEIQAIKAIHDIRQDALKQLEKEAPPDPIINLVMTRVRLEDVLGNSAE